MTLATIYKCSIAISAALMCDIVVAQASIQKTSITTWFVPTDGRAATPSLMPISVFATAKLATAAMDWATRRRSSNACWVANGSGSRVV